MYKNCKYKIRSSKEQFKNKVRNTTNLKIEISNAEFTFQYEKLEFNSKLTQ